MELVRRKKMISQKGPKKVTKIDTSFARNLGIELDLPNAVTLLKGQSMSMFMLLIIVVVFCLLTKWHDFILGENVQFISPLLLKIAGQ